MLNRFFSLQNYLRKSLFLFSFTNKNDTSNSTNSNTDANLGKENTQRVAIELASSVFFSRIRVEIAFSVLNRKCGFNW